MRYDGPTICYPFNPFCCPVKHLLGNKIGAYNADHIVIVSLYVISKNKRYIDQYFVFIPFIVHNMHDM